MPLLPALLLDPPDNKETEAHRTAGLDPPAHTGHPLAQSLSSAGGGASDPSHGSDKPHPSSDSLGWGWHHGLSLAFLG